MSQFPNTELPPDAWMVAIAPGNVQTLSVDQLDAAYQGGHISEQTMVWTHGMDAWAPLGEVLGGDSDEEEAQAAAPAMSAAHQGPAFPIGPISAVAGFSPQIHTAPHIQTAQPMFPVATQPVQQYSPAISSFPSAPMASAPSMSTAPVAMNLDSLDSIDLSDLPKKKSKAGIFALAAIVLGGAGVTVMNLSGSAGASAPAAAAAAQAVHQAEGDKPLVLGKDPNAPLEAKGGYAVSEAETKALAKAEAAAKDMRDKMAEALASKEKEGAKPEKLDKAAAAKAAKGAKAAAASMKSKFSGGGAKASGKAGKKGGASKGGGNSFDPLNGDI